MTSRLADLADPKSDAVGLELEEEHLPQRIRFSRRPRPIKTKQPRVLATAIDLDDGTASLQSLLEVAAYFELGTDEAHRIASEVGKAVATWRKVAAKLCLAETKIDRMASAFEHEDLKAALSFGRRHSH